MDINELIDLGKKVIQVESEALTLASKRLGDNFAKAVNLILDHPGKIIVCGMGKSGHVAQKITATMNSTGTKAVFLHPSEGVHGDLGVYTPGDPTILLSKSGCTEEIIRLIPILRCFKSPIIAIVGSLKSPISSSADIALDASVQKEADPLGFVPTTSAIVSMAIGDSLASALMKVRGFSEQDFARFHPAGQLGRNLLLTVGNVMHPLQNIAIVKKSSNIKEIVSQMTKKPLGATIVHNNKEQFVGIITDGDIRRALQQHENINHLKAYQIMTKNPVSIDPGVSLGDAVRIMENRPNQITVLPVINNTDKKCIGLIRLHDTYQTHIG